MSSSPDTEEKDGRGGGSESDQWSTIKKEASLFITCSFFNSQKKLGQNNVALLKLLHKKEESTTLGGFLS